MSAPVKRTPYPFADTVGAQIRDARTSRKVSINQLARIADVSRRHLAELEKGSNVTILVLKNTMRALGLTGISLGDDIHVTLPGHARDVQAIEEASQQLEVGLSHLLRAAATIKAVTGEPPAAANQKGAVRNELVTKAASLIREFEAHVNSLDSEEKVDALTRLVQASLAPAQPGRPQTVSKKRKGSA